MDRSRKMKQKFTITISDVSLNVVCDESPEAVESLVGIVDRHMREITSKSSRCSKTEAALLCALDFCADKVKMQRKTKKLESLVAQQSIEIEDLHGEIEALKAQLHNNGNNNGWN